MATGEFHFLLAKLSISYNMEEKNVAWKLLKELRQLKDPYSKKGSTEEKKNHHAVSPCLSFTALRVVWWIDRLLEMLRKLRRASKAAMLLDPADFEKSANTV